MLVTIKHLRNLFHDARVLPTRTKIYWGLKRFTRLRLLDPAP
jgi:hypothetical protein